MNEDKQIEMINKNYARNHINDSVVPSNYNEMLRSANFNSGIDISADPEIERRANDARFLDDGMFMGEQITENRYVTYEAQRAARSERRLEAERRRQKIKRALAIATVIGLGAGGIIYADAQMSDRDKIDKEPTRVEQQYEDSMYDEYVDYVQETNGTLSEEGYKNFVENYESSSKGAR